MKPITYRQARWDARKARPICLVCRQPIRPGRLDLHRECVSLKLVRPFKREGGPDAAA